MNKEKSITNPTDRLPRFEEIETLHKKYAPDQEAFDLVFTHCQIVMDIADDLMAQNPTLAVDTELVRAGALLHDIGTYSLYVNGKFNAEKYITHGVRGAEILKEEEFNIKLVRIAAHHTGVGLTQQDIKNQGLPLPKEDFLAETIEERLVMYADKFHSKKPQFNSYDSYAKKLTQFGDGKVAMFKKFREEFGVPNLEVLAERYGHPIV